MSEVPQWVVSGRWPRKNNPTPSRPPFGSAPAFRDERIFLYFAAFKKHIGIYPPVHGPPALVAELEPWRGPKGNLSFPHSESLPLGLIGRVAEALAAQYGTKPRGE